MPKTIVSSKEFGQGSGGKQTCEYTSIEAPYDDFDMGETPDVFNKSFEPQIMDFIENTKQEVAMIVEGGSYNPDPYFYVFNDNDIALADEQSNPSFYPNADKYINRVVHLIRNWGYAFGVPSEIFVKVPESFATHPSQGEKLDPSYFGKGVSRLLEIQSWKKLEKQPDVTVLFV